MSSIHDMPGHLIRRLQQISAAVFADRMRAVGGGLTSPQFAALAVLGERDGIDQATLAALIFHDRATMGGVVERLAAKGWVARSTNPEDRRARLVRLTPEGRAVLDRLLPVVEALQTDILAGLDEAERAEFLRLAQKVVAASEAPSG